MFPGFKFTNISIIFSYFSAPTYCCSLLIAVSPPKLLLKFIIRNKEMRKGGTLRWPKLSPHEGLIHSCDLWINGLMDQWTISKRGLHRIQYGQVSHSLPASCIAPAIWGLCQQGQEGHHQMRPFKLRLQLNQNKPILFSLKLSQSVVLCYQQ